MRVKGLLLLIIIMCSNIKFYSDTGKISQYKRMMQDCFYILKKEYINPEKASAQRLYIGALIGVNEFCLQTNDYTAILKENDKNNAFKYLRLFDSNLNVRLSESDYSVESLYIAALDGMTRSLNDPDTYLLEIPLINLNGKGDIGCLIRLINGKPYIISSYPSSPAALSGLPCGELKEVDGKPVNNKNINQIFDLIKGKSGTIVNLTLLPEGFQKPVSFSIKREIYQINPYHLGIITNNEKNYLYIQISLFNSSITKLINELKRYSDNSIDGIIIDLRSCPGGYLDSVNKFFGIFPLNGVLYHIESQISDLNKKVNADSSGAVFSSNVPIAVLVNKGTCSGAEIFASVMKDKLNARIIGVQTMGFINIQKSYTLNESLIMYYTAARMVPASGISLSESGLKPEFIISNSLDMIDFQESLDLQKLIQSGILQPYLTSKESINYTNYSINIIKEKKLKYSRRIIDIALDVIISDPLKRNIADDQLYKALEILSLEKTN